MQVIYSYCDSKLQNGVSTNAPLDWSKCNMKCSASEYETCGGSATFELFNNPALKPATVSLPTGWSDAGCRIEGSSGRALVGYSFTSSTMTVKLCVDACAARGFSIGKSSSQGTVWEFFTAYT
jgi:hypothetical protein